MKRNRQRCPKSHRNLVKIIIKKKNIFFLELVFVDLKFTPTKLKALMQFHS